MRALKYIVFFVALGCTNLFAKVILSNNYGSFNEITFLMYDENVPAYSIPENLKSTEEVLMYEVLHAVWTNNKWIAYTMNKNLLGTFKVGSPALMENGNVKKIFFCANFPGTRGGMDLYSAEYSNGAWGKPKNMGDVVNTSANEANPGLLDENTLTFSSNGIIKKYNLGSSSLEELSTAQKTETKPAVTTTTVEAPPTPSQVAEVTEEGIKEEPVPATVVQETKPQVQPKVIVQPTAATNSAPSVFTSLGKKGTDAMKASYKNSIQLGVFGNPNWSQLEQFSKFGKLVTFKNEKDLNTVWVTGFKTLTEAENVLQEIRLVPGFEKAYVLK